MNRIRLDGAWRVCDAPLGSAGIAGLKEVTRASTRWMAAKVPGEVHLDLVRAGRMDEPLVSLNAKQCRWPEKRSWWYSRSFKVSPAFLRHERQQLVFDGLDLYAQVFLNGEFLGEAKNAFIPHVFDVRHRLRRENELVVRLTSGEELVPAELCLKGADRRKRQSFAGISHLRKPQFTYGWDWVDVLPNIGIWRGVRLEGHSGIVLHDAAFNTRLQDGKVFLEIPVVVNNLHPWSERQGMVRFTVQPPERPALQRDVEVSAQPGCSSVDCTIEIPHPQLWWPNGMGGQPLYGITLQTFLGTKESDRRDVEIGLRTVAIDRSPIPSGGSRFCMQVNGEDVFCKGGNWIPADAIIARVDKRKYETLVAEAKNANLNMLRIWGGGVYEAPEFYQACDRAGILVWQDFMFACAEYPDQDPAFREGIRAEAESVVRRLRHHPCIALWCGNNENLWAFHGWWNGGKAADDPGIKIGGSKLYNQVLPEVCRLNDPRRPYWPGSPAGGVEPNSETEGDCHWWNPGTMNKDMNRRISHEIYDECRSRFLSEYGVMGPCDMESMKLFLKPGERRPESNAWKEHTNPNEHGIFAAAIRRDYADPERLDLSEWILYGQLFQATMYGRIFEALRFRKHDPVDDCQGSLIWMFNDCWGEIGWTPLDYYLRRKPSYYWIRNACTPVKAIVRRRDDTLVTRVVNDTLESKEVEVHYGWTRVDGMESRVASKAIHLAPNATLEIERSPIPNSAALNPREWIYAAYLSGANIDLAPSIWTLVPYRELIARESQIRVSIKGRRIRLVSDAYCHAVHVEDKGRPLFSDNYFDLLPRVSKTIAYLGAAPPKTLRFRVTA